jgi:integrase
MATNPAEGIERLKEGKPARGAWATQDVSKWLAESKGQPRRAFLLASALGQRRADILALRWEDWDGEAFKIVQGKTAIELVLEMPQSVIDELKPEAAGYVVHRRDGERYTSDGFATMWERECQRLGTWPRTNLHGLRHRLATDLAEAECTIHQIAAVTGHQDLRMIERYTKGANQKKLARSAMAKLAGRV